ncbi:hypothetical protein PybrP1_004997 [[Pythium] brassicae (nom. inval.)]|nr:hypothetical protein PybrP1_004997 [[Pythium] brassicae (nom. inval.)]
MSREERKMAQIIASIERMEQRKAPVGALARADSAGEGDGSSSGGGSTSGVAAAGSAPVAVESPAAVERVNSGEMHAQAQKSTRLGAKGRRLKPLSTSHGAKVKASGSSKRAKPPQELVVAKNALVSCRLTPKKRWIQLWNEQQSSSDEAGSVGPNKAAQSPTAPVPECPQAPPLQLSVADAGEATRPVAAAAREEGEEGDDDPVLEDGEAEADEAPDARATLPLPADASLSSPSPPSDEPKETSISPVPSMKESLKDAPAALGPQKLTGEERESAEAPSDAKPETPASADRLELQTAPAVAPPSAKKEDAAAELSQPSQSSQPAATTTAVASPVAPTASVGDDVAKKASDAKAAAQPTSLVSPSLAARDGRERSSRKRSLEREERLEQPLTEDERRRAERRRVRKSNWDVGDPRFASRNSDKQQATRSPTNDDINSSSCKFPPPGRPAWRHSSSMDATFSGNKSSFSVGNSLQRSSFSGTTGVNGGGGGGGPSRRPFYSSNSLPLDRSRSAGRPSAPGYHHHGNNYR